MANTAFQSDLQNPKAQGRRIRALPVTSAPSARSPARTLSVIEQFHVATAPRYQPQNGRTFCNIFVWDVTTALGCEIPHWVDAGGAPLEPASAGARETRANELVEMLDAGAWGWKSCTQEQAHAHATLGLPVVAGWKHPDPDRPGHMAVAMPIQSGPLVLAQAGKTCGERLPVTRCFGLERVQWWYHA